MLMKEKIKILIITISFFLIALSAWIKPQTDISDTELRKLAKRPQLSLESVLQGEYMFSFEKAALDQFPARDKFRSIKTFVYLYAMNRSDNNGIYIENGYAAKMEYPYNQANVEYACNRFNNVYEKYLKDAGAKCYFSIIPDKNYFLSESHGALSMDYQTLVKTATNKAKFAEYIDIFDELSARNFYRTDTHWNQITILPVAEKVLENMGKEFADDYEVNYIDKPFYGVYYGQAALPMKPDTMCYLENEDTKTAIVTDRQNDRIIPVYDESKFDTRSPYDLFLGGSLSLLSIEHPQTENSGELSTAEHTHLVVFRDSFGSSLIPLMISAYDRIDVLDIRYISSDRLGDYIDFENADVLFIYSASVLNNGNLIK